ncbi:MAG: hypothetical protein DMF86_02920 [Acidobacteria bacterium]|nr:MAG: hypothetical protein DMF86_02920 [Acidobacteriota bacterium]
MPFGFVIGVQERNADTGAGRAIPARSPGTMTASALRFSRASMQICRVSVPLKDGCVADWRDAQPRILIVSHDADFREAAGRVLEREGCAVVGAAHAGHALLAFLEAPFVDVLIADTRMRDDGAGEIAATLRRRRAELQVLYLAAEGMPVPAGRTLVHPFTAEDLILAVRELTEARSASHPPSSADR